MWNIHPVGKQEIPLTILSHQTGKVENMQVPNFSMSKENKSTASRLLALVPKTGMENRALTQNFYVGDNILWLWNE